jgi:hypothetical protein
MCYRLLEQQKQAQEQERNRQPAERKTSQETDDERKQPRIAEEREAELEVE